MPRYLQRSPAASPEDYKLWVSIGYLGTWEDYCRVKKNTAGLVIHFRGDLGEHCADCAGFGDFLCDYPVGDGKTCDRLMCDEHAHEIAPDLHYCEAHYRMWVDFKNHGGVDDVLRNVIAFKSEK